MYMQTMGRLTESTVVVFSLPYQCLSHGNNKLNTADSVDQISILCSKVSFFPSICVMTVSTRRIHTIDDRFTSSAIAICTVDATKSVTHCDRITCNVVDSFYFRSFRFLLPCVSLKTRTTTTTNIQHPSQLESNCSAECLFVCNYMRGHLPHFRIHHLI